MRSSPPPISAGPEDAVYIRQKDPGTESNDLARLYGLPANSRPNICCTSQMNSGSRMVERGSVAKNSGVGYLRCFFFLPERRLHGKSIQVATLRARHHLAMRSLVPALCAQLSRFGRNDDRTGTVGRPHDHLSLGTGICSGNRETVPAALEAN